MTCSDIFFKRLAVVVGETVSEEYSHLLNERSQMSTQTAE